MSDSRRSDRRVVAVAAVLLAAGGVCSAALSSGRQSALFLVGAFLGLALYHASFGFTAAYRRLLVERRGAGVRAQLLLLAIFVVLFFPALGEGTLFGQPVHGNVAPVGVRVVVGACLFGVGMQLGGGCASGTLFAVGSGNPRMMVTLLFFVVGAVAGAAHQPYWASTPSFGATSMVRALGWPAALALHLAVFAALAGLTVLIERRAHGHLERARPPGAHWLRGPWPLTWGAGALALGSFATLALSGRPWGVSSAFALWGTKAAWAMGADVTSWAAWSSPAQVHVLERALVHDVSSVMDVGLLAGALLAVGLAGRFAPLWRFPLRSLLAAIIGGLLLGYGARIAFGCNIGAFLGGVASGSAHGWVWIGAALVGNWLGAHARPLFGLPRR